MSRDDRDQIIADLERGLHNANVDRERLSRELYRLRCEYRRVCEEIDWRDEQIRVLRRVIDRLIKEKP